LFLIPLSKKFDLKLHSKLKAFENKIETLNIELVAS